MDKKLNLERVFELRLVSNDYRSRKVARLNEDVKELYKTPKWHDNILNLSSL